MAMSAKWIDELFRRLSVRYGAAFLRQWPDADPSVVKADWMSVLSGCSGHDIAYALQYLPEGLPPNAMQFRAICRRAPAPEAPRIEGPKADPGRVAALVAQAGKAPADGLTPAHRVAYVLRKKITDGVKLTLAQRAQLDAIDRMHGVGRDDEAAA